MKTFIFSGVLVAALTTPVARPVGSPALAQGRQSDPRDRALQMQDMFLAGPGAEIGVRIAEGKDGGVLVDEVGPDSPAEKAGLKKSDVIVEFDGERVRSGRQFSRLVQETAPGRTVKTTVLRDGKKMEVQITPRERRGGLNGRGAIDGDVLRDRLRDLDALRGQLPRGPFNFDFDVPGAPSGRRLGVTTGELTDQLAQYFGAKEGVLVTSVADGSPASRAGLKAGDVITSIEGQSVRSRDDLVRGLRDARGAEVTIGIVREKKESSVKVTIETPPRRTLRNARPI